MRVNKENKYEVLVYNKFLMIFIGEGLKLK